MTATPPDPEPDATPGLEPGGGVPPGATPPESGQTSGLSHPQPIPSKGVPIVTIVLAALGTLLVAALLFALAAGWFSV
ncbi:DUF6480 family protein [Amycolatopsis albispora]|uniref:Uncharacterized protein n=1 Tax=Amycolatopsis albispora TaxID=1804986 RepID=A0A344KZ79_9PSEU|nr:DUF6480 family protein [Amycolatopsis albispora]AXB41103.1 hypothetical protein A4R43_00050 [Amycolatopsis albispora]